jgi:hypothetical protein
MEKELLIKQLDNVLKARKVTEKQFTDPRIKRLLKEIDEVLKHASQE